LIAKSVTHSNKIASKPAGFSDFKNSLVKLFNKSNTHNRDLDGFTVSSDIMSRNLSSPRSRLLHIQSHNPTAKIKYFALAHRN
jgi:hypothetical protein